MQAAEDLLQEAARQVQQKHWRSALAAEAEAVAGIRQEHQDVCEKISLKPRPKELPPLPPAKVVGGTKPVFDPAQLPSLLPSQQPEAAVQQSQSALEAARAAWQAVARGRP